MSLVEVRVPDLGDAKGVNVVDVLIKKGSEIRVDDPLITLETEKASMDVPSPVSGVVDSIALKKGDEVSAGALIATVQVADARVEAGCGGDAAPRPRRRRARGCAGARGIAAAPPARGRLASADGRNSARRRRRVRHRRGPSIWWCSGPVWAATPPHFAPPISASRSR